MSLKTVFLLKIVLLLILTKYGSLDAQILGNIFRDPLNNLIKVFDGSYGDNNRNNNQDNSLSFQSRGGSNDAFDHSGGYCARIWSYRNDGAGHTIGNVVIRNPDHSKNVLQLMMSLSAALPSEFPGSIDLAKDKDITANDVINGLPLLYNVRFPVENPLPRILSVTLNGKLLCSETAEQGPTVTLMLEHTFYSGLSAVNVPQEEQILVTPAPSVYHKTNRPLATYAYTTSSSPVPVSYLNAESESDCGVPDFEPPKTTALVFGGFLAMRKQYPWIAAFFYNGRDENGFVCGGSLVSSKIVVTAAHCVQNKGQSSAKNVDQSVFYLGKYDLTDLTERYYAFSGVERFDVHPDWKIDDNKFDADIAIVALMRKISFNSFIKPICLWTASSSYEDLVGHKGTIVGWGKTENSSLPSQKPNWADITVVSNINCLRANSAFNELTSDRTFCAGEKNKMKGPCNGDSGGGLVVQNAGKWYLRGIVSSSLLADGVCDTNNYAVFTDVQRYSSWIKSFIETYG